MNISILTVFPELYEQFLNTSLIKNAQDKNIISVDVNSFFSVAPLKKRIDAPSFGPGSGMLIRPEIVQEAIELQEGKHGGAFKVFFSPHGEKLDQRMLEKIALRIHNYGHLMLIPARYEGMDTRVEQEYADVLLSVGDFVLMGGDLPAMMLLEGLLRLIPGVVGKKTSVEQDSFSGPFVDYPEYTQPVEWKGRMVPEVVRSGNHGVIAQWRSEQAAQRTVAHHFNWMRSQEMTPEQMKCARAYIPRHYVALVHGDVLIGKDRVVGETSVTTIDLHDIARSSKTYGIINFFVVTPLLDQQRIVNRLLDFWFSESGIEYNENRHEAVRTIVVTDTIEDAIASIEAQEGVRPLVITTSAIAPKMSEKLISFSDQQVVWGLGRPVLLVFGTGQGLRDEFIDQADFQLMPISGFSDFNHLSVRSAAAITLDRWLGIQGKMVRNDF